MVRRRRLAAGYLRLSARPALAARRDGRGRQRDLHIHQRADSVCGGTCLPGRDGDRALSPLLAAGAPRTGTPYLEADQSQLREPVRAGRRVLSLSRPRAVAGPPRRARHQGQQHPVRTHARGDRCRNPARFRIRAAADGVDAPTRLCRLRRRQGPTRGRAIATHR